jgi:hypothetical protein
MNLNFIGIMTWLYVDKSGHEVMVDTHEAPAIRAYLPKGTIRKLIGKDTCYEENPLLFYDDGTSEEFKGRIVNNLVKEG